MLPVQDFGEAAHGVAHGHILAGLVGESFGHKERLGEEALYFAGAEHGLPVVVGKFLNAQNGDDVLQVAVALQHLLHAPRHAVVFVAHDARLQDAGKGRQGVHRRVQALRGQRPFQ